MPAFLLSLLGNWRVWAVAGVIGALLWWRHAAVAEAVATERERHEKAWAAQTEKHRAEVADYVVAMSARITEAQAQHAAKLSGIRTDTIILKERTLDYITPLSAARCVVPRGFVLHHDAAWTGDLAALSRSPGRLVDEPSGVPLDRVADVNADNAGACRALAAESAAWRAWYITELAEWEAFRQRRASEVMP